MTPRTPGARAARPVADAGSARAGGPAMPPVPDTPLLVAGPFAGLPALAVAGAIASGLRSGGWRSLDVGMLAEELEMPYFDSRLRRARAVVIAQRRLAEAGLQGTPAFEIATRARQAGVPCFAVTARNGLSAFDARMLDLQIVLEAGTRAALARAGRALAGRL
jgi:glycerate kinase